MSSIPVDYRSNPAVLQSQLTIRTYVKNNRLMKYVWLFLHSAWLITFHNPSNIFTKVQII